MFSILYHFSWGKSTLLDTTAYMGEIMNILYKWEKVFRVNSVEYAEERGGDGEDAGENRAV